LILVVDEGDLEHLVGLMHQPKAAVVPIAGAPKFPDTRSVTGLRMEVGTSDGVLIEVEGDVASMSGSPASFARLAREFRLFRELNDLNEPGMHAHFDPGYRSRGEIAVSHQSAPLFLAGPVSGDPE
jgi:hypothetical protein